MKVVYCITRSDTIGGAHVHVADMAGWMRARGHEVTVIVGGDGLYRQHLERKGIPSRSCPSLCRALRPLSDLRATVCIRRLLKEMAPDVISLHSAKAGVLGRIAVKGLGVPVVFTAHGWAFTEGVRPARARLYRTIERFAAPLADRIVTVSDYDRRLALGAGVGTPEQIITIHNGMPDMEQPAAPGEERDVVGLIMVARLDVPKDHESVLRALAALRGSSWRLDLVGDGAHESAIRSLVQDLGLGDRVRLLGLRDDVGQLLAAAQIFVLASRWEGFPRSILEAMRAGLPVVASDVGGVSEAVVDGTTGYLVPEGDVEALRERLSALLDSAAERAAMGAAGRARFDQRYRFTGMAQRTMDLYAEIAGQR